MKRLLPLLMLGLVLAACAPRFDPEMVQARLDENVPNPPQDTVCFTENSTFNSCAMAQFYVQEVEKRKDSIGTQLVRMDDASADLNVLSVRLVIQLNKQQYDTETHRGHLTPAEIVTDLKSSLIHGGLCGKEVFKMFFNAGGVFKYDIDLKDGTDIADGEAKSC